MVQAARCFVLSAALFGLFGRSVPASGQPVRAASTDPTGTHAGYTHRAWTTDDGLPQNSATALVQTRDGYLWIGTFQGLARFDGIAFTVFEAATTEGLEGDRIRTLLEDREGALWIGTETGGLSRYRDGRFTAFTTDHGVLANFVLALYEDARGVLWVSTTAGLAYGRRQDESMVFTLDPLARPDNVPGAFYDDPDRPDSLWLGTPAGLMLRQQDAHTTSTPADGLTGERIITLAAGRDGSLWIGTVDGINRLKGEQITTYPVPGTSWELLEDRNGTIWAAVEGGGLLRFDGSGFVPPGLPGDEIGNDVISVMEDREGSLWIGTNGNGLHQLKERLFAAYTLEDGLPSNQIHGVYEDRNGAIWAGMSGSGLVRLQNRSLTRYTMHGLLGSSVWSMAEDDEGRLWVGGSRGNVRFDGRRFAPLQDDGTAPYSDFRVLTRSSSGTLWIGAWGGLFRYRDDHISLVLGRDRLPETGVQVIHEAPSGALWFGTRGGGLCRYEDDALTCFTTEDGLSNNAVRAIYPVAEDTLWLGTYGGGLCQLASERFTCLTKQHGLPDGTVHHILEDDFGFIWLPSNKGIFRLARRALEHFFAGKTDRVYPDVYGTSDGMPSSECNGGFQPAGWKARDGRLWFPTTGGLAVVDPARVATEEALPVPPPVYVEQVIVDGRPAPRGEPLALEAGSDRLVFHYTAPHLSAPEKVRFRSLYGLRVRSLKRRQRHLEVLVEERTERLRAEKRKTEEQAQLLTELDEAKSRFFANVSHEFRTPLMLITGPLEQGLTTIEDPDELRRQEGIMLRNARRLLRLVNQLLDLAKIESGRMTLQAEPGDLATFLRDLVRSFQPLAERKNLALTLRAETAPLPFVFDRNKLEKAVGNLLSNALKFTPEGGKVWVTLHEVKGGDGGAPSAIDSVEIVVKDTGPGIPPEALPKIFERFKQVDDSATRRHEGTGIGLALARELVELHRGTIRVESEPGFGSAFTVRLPVTDVPALEEPSEAAPLSQAVLEEAMLAARDDRPTTVPAAVAEDAPVVLVVEDHAEVRALVRGYLEPAYRVLEADNGQAGLEAAREARPDLILSDVMMPVMDGFALCRAVKADAQLRAIPIVLLTARASEQDTVEGLESGADDFLTKPFSADELRARVARHIAARQQLRAQFSREVRVEPAGISVPSEEEAFLAQVLGVVQAQMGEAHFGPEALAEELGLSPRQLRRRLRATTTQTPHRFIQQIRLQRAAQLLEARTGTVAEVAYRVGFKNESHFSRAFREHFGHTPTEHLSDRGPV